MLIIPYIDGHFILARLTLEKACELLPEEEEEEDEEGAGGGGVEEGGAAAVRPLGAAVGGPAILEEEDTNQNKKVATSQPQVRGHKHYLGHRAACSAVALVQSDSWQTGACSGFK